MTAELPPSAAGGESAQPENDKKILFTRVVGGIPVFSWEPTTDPLPGQFLNSDDGTASIWKTIADDDIDATLIPDGWEMRALSGHGKWSAPHIANQNLLQGDNGAYGDCLQNPGANITTGTNTFTIASGGSEPHLNALDDGQTVVVSRAATDARYPGSQGPLIGELEYVNANTGRIWLRGSNRTTPMNATRTCIDTLVNWGHDDTAAVHAWYARGQGANVEGGDDEIASGSDNVAEPGRYLVFDNGTGTILTILKTAQKYRGLSPAGSHMLYGATGLSSLGGASFVTCEPVTVFQSGPVPPTKTIHRRTTVEDLGFEDISNCFVQKSVRLSGTTHWFVKRTQHYHCKYNVEMDPINSKDSSWGHVYDMLSTYSQIAVYAPQHSIDVTGYDFEVDIGQAGFVRGGDLYLKIEPGKQDHHSCWKFVAGRTFDFGYGGADPNIDIIPSTPNGHRYTPIVVPVGTGSGSGYVGPPLPPSEPSWPTNPGAKTTLANGWQFQEAGIVRAWDGGTLTGPIGIVVGGNAADDGGGINSAGGAGRIAGLAIEHHNEQMDDFYESVGIKILHAPSGISIQGFSSGGGNGKAPINSKRGTGVWVNGKDATSGGLTRGVDIAQCNLSNWNIGLRCGPFSQNTSVKQWQSSGGNTTNIWIEDGSILNLIDGTYSGSNTATIQDDNVNKLANTIINTQLLHSRQNSVIVPTTPVASDGYDGDLFLIEDTEQLGWIVNGNLHTAGDAGTAPVRVIALFLPGTIPATADDAAVVPMIAPWAGTIVGVRCYATTAPTTTMAVQVRRAPDAATPTFVDATGVKATFVANEHRAKDSGSVAMLAEDILNFSITGGSGADLVVEILVAL